MLLAGKAIMRRVARGEFDEAEFRSMMDDYLLHSVDRALFELD